VFFIAVLDEQRGETGLRLNFGKQRQHLLMGLVPGGIAAVGESQQWRRAHFDGP